MINVPLVSICCITYNHADFIEECLDGFLRQHTNFQFEILIHDDASTDGTSVIIEEYSKNHENLFKPIIQNENQYSKGIRAINSTFNFPRAKGKYIALCEGDDYWTDPLKLQKQVDFLEANPAFSSCFHPVQILKGNEFVEDHITRKVPDVTCTKDLLEGNFIHTPSVVFRNFFDAAHSAKFIEATRFSPIGDLLLHIFNAQFGKIYRLEEPMAVYRLGAGTWSSLSKAVRIQKTIKAYLSLIQLLKKTEDFEAVYTRIENYFLQLQALSEPQPPKKTLTLEEVSIKTHLQLVLRKLKQKFL